jgi:hypothetical protein
VGRDNVRAGVQPFHPPQKSQKPHKEFIKLQFASEGVIPSEFTATRIYIRHAETYLGIHGRMAGVPFDDRRRM